MMRLGGVLLLLVAGGAAAAPVCTLQRGLVVMPAEFIDPDGGSAAQSLGATLTSAVDLSRAMLWFNVRTSGGDVSCMKVKGRLFADRVQFERQDRGSEQPVVSWTVVEFCSGASVERGDEPVDMNTLIPVTPFDPAKSFVTASAQASVSDYNPDSDNFLLATPEDGMTVRVQHGQFFGRTAAWQRYSDDGMTVQRGRLAFTPGIHVIDTPVTVPPNAFARVTWRGLTGLDQDMLLTARIEGSAVRVARGEDGGSVDAVWELVSYADGTRVQTGTVSFAQQELVQQVTLGSPVDLSRSVSFLAGHDTYGMSPRSYASASITTRLVDGTTVELERSSSTNSATADFVVLEFPATAVTPDAGLLPDGGAGPGPSAPLEILSEPEASASCNQPWRYLPSAQGPGRVTWTVRAVGGELPGGLFVNTDTGEVLFRPTRGGAAEFELVASSAGQSVSQRVSLDVACERVGVGGSCSSAPGLVLGLVALLLRRRRVTP